MTINYIDIHSNIISGAIDNLRPNAAYTKCEIQSLLSQLDQAVCLDQG